MIRRSAILLLALAALAGLSCEKSDQAAVTAQAPTIVRTQSGIEMVLLPGGWFEMGSDRGKPDEAPVHRVWVDSFLMDRTEATQEQYCKVFPPNPSHFKAPDRPVEQISWARAAMYCNERSLAEGLLPCYDETGQCNFQANGYRLPTEAEWEYACRAGEGADYSFGPDPRELRDYAWFADNSAKMTHPVGQKQPNPLGLFDLYGNVAEWCNDVYRKATYKSSPERNPRGPAKGDKNVLRGGAWNSSADACRSSYRVGEDPGFQDACFALDAIGFRCVRNAPPADQADQPDPPQAAAKTGFVYDDIYLLHKTGASHPERPERLTAIVNKLKADGLLGQLSSIAVAPAPLEWVTTIHSPEYVERVRKSCEEGGKYLDTMDNPLCPDTYRVALAAAGGVLAAVDAVMEGKVRNAFCAIRPPGHHALKDKGMGFCFFNNVAIAARYLQKRHKLTKILIVDWDVHHGNGTQAAFHEDPTVLHFDVHRSPFYPGTGRADETGSGPGLGSEINVPMAGGSGDKDYLEVFEKKLVPAAAAFQPEFVLISAGFDAYKGDPLGGMALTADGYAALTKIVRGIAEKSCKGRLVSVLEGGYNLDGLASSVEAHLRALME